MEGPGLPSDHYYLYRRFIMPTEDGGKAAVAIPKSRELLVVSFYTVIIGGIFTAWWIILMSALPHIIFPRRLRNTKAIAKVANWDMTEPLQAAIIMGRISWTSIYPHLQYRFRRSLHYCCNIWGHRRRTKPALNDQEPQPIQWRGLLVALIVLLLALGTSIAGILSGIYLPEKMVIGNVAPVNETIVSAFIRRPDSGTTDDAGTNYPHPIRRKPATRAMSIYDSSTIDEELDEKVNVTKTHAPGGPNGEEGYGIEYEYSIAGWEMGLIKLRTLTYNVVGKCTFEYDWYRGIGGPPAGNSTTVQFEKYIWNDTVLWGSSSASGNQSVDMLITRFNWESSTTERAVVKPWHVPAGLTSSDHSYPTMGFVFLPGVAQEMYKYTLSSDPWYMTEKYILKIKTARPALNCREWTNWYYEGTRLGDRISTLNDDNLYSVEHTAYNNETRPPLIPGLGVNIPEGIARLLGVRFSIPLAARFVDTVLYGKLESTNRRVSTNTMSLTHASAYLDVKRAVGGGYILGRNIFRDAARNYADRDMPESFKTHFNLFYNMTTKKPFPGTGDFVVPSAKVSTLRFEAILAVPLVLAISWVVAWIVMWLKPVPKIVEDHKELHADYTYVG